MANRNFITVEELNFYINNVFLSEELLRNVPVVGEVSGCSVVGGHCYFTLKDSVAQIKVCLFNCEGKYVPRNGEKVLVRGGVDFYIKNGTISIKAYEITYFGEGMLEIRFNKLKEKLEQEGLFCEEYKKDLPENINRVAVITSIKGAAIQDFITTARSRNSAVDISIIDVRVQGESCVNDVITALNNADKSGFDMIIIARGGGSYEDLFCFNDEALVRAVFDANTPVVSAIGHETDYTLCDFVADYRAITPTAAGELVASYSDKQKNKIKSLIRKISDTVNNRVEDGIDEFVENCDNLRQTVELLLQRQYNIIANSMEKMKIFQNASFERAKNDIVQKLNILEQLNPLKLLNKGYFRILKENKFIYSLAEIKENDVIKIVGHDGSRNAVVLSGGENELRK